MRQCIPENMNADEKDPLNGMKLSKITLETCLYAKLDSLGVMNDEVKKGIGDFLQDICDKGCVKPMWDWPCYEMVDGEPVYIGKQNEN